MSYNFNDLWGQFFEDRKRKLVFFLTCAALIITLFSFSKFLSFNETRNGFAFDDAFLKLFNPVDLTWFTFTLIYGGLVAGLINLARIPDKLMLAFQTYTAMVLIRMLAMYSLPLDPPADTIALADPFVQLFGSGKILMRDLFFSGHTATMFILFLTVPKKKLKKIFLSLTILVGLFVILQHAHYTIDVIAAPFFTYASHRIAVVVNQKIYA